jgi:hypothetical protein
MPLFLTHSLIHSSIHLYSFWTLRWMAIRCRTWRPLVSSRSDPCHDPRPPTAAIWSQQACTYTLIPPKPIFTIIIYQIQTESCLKKKIPTSSHLPPNHQPGLMIPNPLQSICVCLLRWPHLLRLPTPPLQHHLLPHPRTYPPQPLTLRSPGPSSRGLWWSPSCMAFSLLCSASSMHAPFTGISP